MKKSGICFLFLVCFILFSCSDDDSETGNSDSVFDSEAVAEILNSHPWKLDYQLSNLVEEDPYIITFLNNGFVEYANFSEWSKEEEKWEVKDGKLIIDGMSFSIDKITSQELDISITEDGIPYSYNFTEEGDEEGFPLAIIGKVYLPVSGKYTIDGETEEFDKENREDGHDFTQKIWFEENDIITFTDTMLHYASWNKISESFIFLEEQGDVILDDRKNVGFEISHGSTDDLTLKTYYIEGNGGVKSSESYMVTTTVVLREVNLWEYLDGPNWVLKEVDKNEVELTEFPDMPLGTIWFFNSFTHMVEERTDYSDADIDYMPWNFTEEPSESNIRIDITLDDTVEPNEVKTFKMMLVNIAELWLSTEIDGDTYTFKFEVEPYAE